MLQTDFNTGVGRIRPLNGINCGPTLKTGSWQNQLFKDLNVPYVRLHDVPLVDAGLKLVDVPMIFANFHADADDPRNYYFRQTDDYIKNTIACGGKIIFRLGVSIEWSINKYFTYPPADFEKWTNICINIIRHYNEGWADGFYMGIEYWEIWNEPDAHPMMWAADFEQYCELYKVASTGIKARFPHIKIGGFAAGDEDVSLYGDRAKRLFLKFCREHDLPLDFFSWHIYSDDPAVMIDQPGKISAMLREYGYEKAELHLNEWHFMPKVRKNGYWWRSDQDGPNSADAAAYTAAVLTGWQDTPLTLGAYYVFNNGYFGVVDFYSRAPLKPYFALKFFGIMLKYTGRVKCADGENGVRVLAGKSEDGRRAMLVSAFKTPGTVIRLAVTGADNVSFTVCRCDVTSDEAESVVKCENGVLTLEKSAGSALFLLEEK